MTLNLSQLLTHQVKNDFADLHLVTGEPPLVRARNGNIEPLPGFAPLTETDVEKVIHDLIGETNWQKFLIEKEYDFGFEEPKLGRFRASFYETMRGPALACRFIPFEIPTPALLDIPKEIQDAALRPDGLILVTGPNGHGKSTTLASLVEHINLNRKAHIVTIEDPIEFVFTPKKSVISQRAVGQNTLSFPKAVKHTVRQDVDVIVVGEMRDLETISTVITLAETGHLVLATLHTHDAPRAVQRIVDVFPAAQQEQIAIQLSHSLTAVISQRLIPRKDNTGRVCAREIMLVNDAIRHAIRSRKISEIYSQIQTNRDAGMRPFDSHLLEFVKSGEISMKEALLAAHDQKQMKRQITELGLRD